MNKSILILKLFFSLYFLIIVTTINNLHAAEVFSRCGPWGGRGGNEYDDGNIGGLRIKEIRVFSGNFVDSIQVIYINQLGMTITGKKHGGRGGKLKLFKLYPDEYITTIGGRYGWYVDQLFIKTNKGRYEKWGGAGGSLDFFYSVPTGTSVHGFWGKAGKYIDSIGVIVKTKKIFNEELRQLAEQPKKPETLLSRGQKTSQPKVRGKSPSEKRQLAEDRKKPKGMEQPMPSKGKVAHGFVVGRVYLRLDGFQGQRRDIIAPVKVKLTYIDDKNRQLVFTTQSDHQGYFSLSDAPLSGWYHIRSIVQDNGIEIPNPISKLDPSDNKTKRIIFYLSSMRKSFPLIIDCGQNIILLKKENNNAIVYGFEHQLDKISIILNIQSKRCDKVKGSIGYPGLEHYAQSGSAILQKTAKEALEDRQALSRAKSLLKSIPKGTKVPDLIREWYEVLRVHSGIEEAYLKMAFVLKLMKKQEKAVQLFQQYLKEKPNDLWARVYLLRSYLAIGNINDAIQVAKETGNSFVYYQAYQSLHNNSQFDQAEQMLRKAIETYSDGSLFTIGCNELQDRLATLRLHKKTQSFFISYLKAIQDDNDYENWKGKPYDLFIKRNPIVK